MHGHCHHKAIIGFDAEQACSSELGLDVELPDAGCCGMAGAFGFERGDHYDVSIARRRARAAARGARAPTRDTLILADGFSCREQIASRPIAMPSTSPRSYSAPYPKETQEMPELTEMAPHVLREYALLADGERGVLVGPRGDFVWMCFPRWDSDGIFSSLIGGARRVHRHTARTALSGEATTSPAA